MSLYRISNLGGLALLMAGGAFSAVAPGCEGEIGARGDSGPVTGPGAGGSGGTAGGGGGGGGTRVGGSAPGGGSGGDCTADTHDCDGQCVPDDDPAFACG